MKQNDDSEAIIVSDDLLICSFCRRRLLLWHVCRL